MKRCCHCRIEKPLDEFSNNRTGKDGKHHACKVCKAAEQKSRHARSKRELFVRYSENEIISCQCPKCDITDERFLTIDHINNDGTIHRKKIGPGIWAFYWWAKKHGFPDGFQVLCYNCNGAKARNGGICPHMDEDNFTEAIRLDEEQVLNTCGE